MAKRIDTLRLGQDNSAAKVLDAFLRLCGQHNTEDWAFSAGSPVATTTKWDRLVAHLRRAPINLGGVAYTYAQVLNLASADLDFVQPYSTPAAGGNFPGWSGMAQGLRKLWLARNQKASATKATAPAAALTATQQYSGPEQAYAILCDDSPSPPASAYPGLQRLTLAGGEAGTCETLAGPPPLSQPDERNLK